MWCWHVPKLFFLHIAAVPQAGTSSRQDPAEKVGDVLPFWSQGRITAAGKAPPLRHSTESQNGRGWKGPLWVTQSNPLPKQGHPEQAVQDHVQVGLESLQRRRLHNLPSSPVSVTSVHSVPGRPLITSIKIGRDGLLLLT